ncbi:MAG: glycoside hydrolase family 3 protein, partial [Flavobacteriaceae bacterium]
LAIYPPMVKPIDNFGFSREELDIMDRLSRNKDVILYLFGNPYFLKLLNLENHNSIWAVFQDFPEFEQNAARHFLGEVDAPGILPVSIEKN